MSRVRDEAPAIENVFSSKGRVRILRILAKVGELNISGIARKAELNYTTTNQHLLALEKAGLVQEKRFGRVRVYRYRNDSPRAQAIKRFIDFWETNE